MGNSETVTNIKLPPDCPSLDDRGLCTVPVSPPSIAEAQPAVQSPSDISYYTSAVHNPRLLVSYLNDRYGLELPEVASEDKGRLIFSRNESTGEISARINIFQSGGSRNLSALTHLASRPEQVKVTKQKMGDSRKPVKAVTTETRVATTATHTIFPNSETTYERNKLNTKSQNITTALGDIYRVICASPELQLKSHDATLCIGMETTLDQSGDAALEGVLKRSLLPNPTVVSK